MANLKKEICKWTRGDFVDHYAKHSKVIAVPRFGCKKCGRVAAKKKWLCKSFRLNLDSR